MSRVHSHRPLLHLNWRLILSWLGGVIVAGAVLFYRLGSIVPSLSPHEQALWNTSGDWHTIIANPINAPYKALLWTAHFLPLPTTLAARLPSVLIALTSLVLFVIILHRWYGLRTTVFGFFIFFTSAWVLHVGRFAGPDVMYILVVLALIATHIGLYDHGDRWPMLYLWLFVNIAALFVPGVVWFVLFGLALQAGTLWSALRTTDGLWQRILWIVAAAAGISAVAAAAYRLELWRQWLGLPDHFATWPTMLLQAGRAWVAVAYRGPVEPETWLGRLPILGVFMSLMLVAGVVFYARHYRAARTHMLAGYLVLASVLIALGGVVTLSVMVPTLYLIAVAGVAYVLHFWLRMFPRNQLARGTGIAMVSAAVALACLYTLQQYFIAWPHNPDTAAAYHYKLKL